MTNPIDAIVDFVSPAAGLRRVQARALSRILSSGYSSGGASTGKNAFKGWRWFGGSTKEDIEEPLPTLRQRSRDLWMNSPIARAALSRIATNVIGCGLQLRAMPDAETLGISSEQAAEWSRRVAREWELWAGSTECDRLGLSTFDELQQVALLSWLQSGDVFALLPLEPRPGQTVDLRVHLIEADRACNPSPAPEGKTLRDGVEIDSSGRVLAYHIRSSHPLSSSFLPESARWTRVPVRGSESGRRNILHLMSAERPEQYRGVPALAPVIESCKQLSRYAEAELMAAVVASLYTVFIKSETPQTPLGEALPPESAAEISMNPDYDYSLGPGAIVALNPNEDISLANPGRPNAQFDVFVSAVSKEIGAAINVPSELLLLQFTASYSASRAALLEAWKGFRMWRSWMAADFCGPVYEEWLTEAVLNGRVEAPGLLDDPLTRRAWRRAEWHGPAPGQVDPMKEVQAAKMRVEEGFSTRSRETAELTGGDYEANITQRAEEERMRSEAGLV